MPDYEQTDHARPGQGPALTRRAVVAGTGMLAVSAALAGCSGYGTDTAQPNTTGQAATPGTAQPAPGAAQQLASTSDIPVGGGQVFPEQKVVVTQPAEGTFKAFSAVCTHQGCTVEDVAGGTINCPCHGSKFSIKDGSVVKDPAKRPLAPREIVVQGDEIQLA